MVRFLRIRSDKREPQPTKHNAVIDSKKTIPNERGGRNRVEEGQEEILIAGLPAIVNGTWRILAKYTVGPVEYAIYRDERGLARLHFKEPEPPSEDRIKELLSGLEPPSTIAEKYYVDKHRSGYGRLYPLIIDPYIEEIAVDGPQRPIAVIHKYQPSRWIDVDLKLTKEEADALSLQLARKAGRLVSIAMPIAEGLTEEGHRIAVTFSREVSRFGSTLVVRKYPDKPITISDLIASKVLSPLAAAYLWMLVEAQGFLIIIGNMGSGKTTLLQALAGLIPPFYRIVTIEDTPELRLPHNHWDSLVSRPTPPGGEIADIGLEELLRFALRRRAEYVIVGEVRGREARLLAQAAASGHGSMTTFHADSPEGAILRLRLDPINLPPLFVHVITAFVQVRRIPVRGGGALRRLISITEVDGEELVETLSWNPALDTHEPKSAEELAENSTKLRAAWEKLGMPGSDPAEELADRAAFLEEASRFTPDEFYERLLEYYVSKYGEAGDSI